MTDFTAAVYDLYPTPAGHENIWKKRTRSITESKQREQTHYETLKVLQSENLLQYYWLSQKYILKMYKCIKKNTKW